MKNLVILVFICIFLLSNVFALCEENQININSVSKEELDKLYGIGPVKAEAIMDSRPFNSVENLIDVYGIGEATLEKIKDQGLACVEEETEKEPEIEKEKEIEEINKKEKHEENIEIIKEEVNEKEENIELKTINLNAQTIKSEENMNNLNKSNYAMYGFVGFCVLLGIVLVLKKRKNCKTEFE